MQIISFFTQEGSSAPRNQLVAQELVEDEIHFEVNLALDNPQSGLDLLV